LIIDSTKIGFNEGLRAASFIRAGVFIAAQQPLLRSYKHGIRGFGFVRVALGGHRYEARAARRRAIRRAKKNRAAKRAARFRLHDVMRA